VNHSLSELASFQNDTELCNFSFELDLVPDFNFSPRDLQRENKPLTQESNGTETNVRFALVSNFLPRRNTFSFEQTLTQG
jgi:hypothetical protein